jgi:tyrosinase
MGLGGVAEAFSGFRQMEFDPHGAAHVSFGGPINSPPTAVRDPLFFMLHANVDRLWAKWQWVNHRADPAEPLAYAAPNPDRDGHRLHDTMWPWNGVTGGSRPPTAPGGPFPTRPVVGPGATPTVQSMLDYAAVVSQEPLGFAYDDVPFELPPDLTA